MSQSPARRRVVMALAAPLLAVVLAGCATTGSAPIATEGDKAVLQKRAQTYWNLVSANDSVSAWAYETSSKDQSMTLENYLKRGGITYEAVEVREVVSIEGDDAVVKVHMRYSLPMLRLKAQENTVEDKWRKIGGVWHHVLRRSANFPDSKS